MRTTKIPIPGRMNYNGERTFQSGDIRHIVMPELSAEDALLYEKALQGMFLESVDERVTEIDGMRTNGKTSREEQQINTFDNRATVIATHQSMDDFQLVLQEDAGMAYVIQAIEEEAAAMKLPEGAEKFEKEYEILFERHGEGLPYLGDREQEIVYSTGEIERDDELTLSR